MPSKFIVWDKESSVPYDSFVCVDVLGIYDKGINFMLHLFTIL